MCVLHAEYNDGRDFGPVQAAVGLQRNRIVTHLKQHPVGAIEVNRQLSGSITSQFVTSTWEVAHSFKRRRRTHIVEPPSDQFGSMSTVAAH
jgi:hypothetical protein